MRSKTFFDLFPTPKVLTMPHHGIDISDDAMHFIELLPHGRRYRLGRYDKTPLSQGVIENGVIREPKLVTKILDGWRAKYNLRNVRASLPEEKSYLYKTTLPVATLDNIQSSVEFTIEENVPLSPQEAVFSFEIVPSSKQEHEHIDVVVTVLPREVVESYLEVFHQAKLQPISFYTESQAIIRACVPDSRNENYIVVNLNQEKAGIYVVNRRAVHFASTLVLAGADKVSSLIAPEISKVKNYWLSHQQETDKRSSIKTVIVVGEAEKLEGLQLQLNKLLNMEIFVADVWTNVLSVNETIPSITFNESLRYAGAIGLALYE